MEKTVRVPWYLFEEMLVERYEQASEWWGAESTADLWESYLAFLQDSEIAPHNADPKILVDNYLVNSEIVTRGEFREGGEWAYYANRFSSWEELCENALFSSENCACMRIAL